MIQNTESNTPQIKIWHPENAATNTHEIWVQAALYRGECCEGQSTPEIPWAGIECGQWTGSWSSQCGGCGSQGRSWSMSDPIQCTDNEEAETIGARLAAALTIVAEDPSVGLDEAYGIVWVPDALRGSADDRSEP